MKRALRRQRVQPLVVAPHEHNFALLIPHYILRLPLPTTRISTANLLAARTTNPPTNRSSDSESEGILLFTALGDAALFELMKIPWIFTSHSHY